MINANTKFLGVDSTKVDLTERKDGINNAKTEFYTAQEIVDAVGGGEDYKIYSARIRKTSQSDPFIVTVFKNTYSQEPTITNIFNNQSLMLITLDNEFIFDKTMVLVNPERNNILIAYPNPGDSNISVDSYNFEGGQSAPIEFTIEIKTYN